MAKERRYKRVLLPMERLSKMLEVGTTRPTKVVEGVPEGARLVNVSYAADVYAIQMLYEHPSFADVHFGLVIPELKVNFAYAE